MYQAHVILPRQRDAPRPSPSSLALRFDFRFCNDRQSIEKYIGKVGLTYVLAMTLGERVRAVRLDDIIEMCYCSAFCPQSAESRPGQTHQISLFFCSNGIFNYFLEADSHRNGPTFSLENILGNGHWHDKLETWISDGQTRGLGRGGCRAGQLRTDIAPSGIILL